MLPQKTTHATDYKVGQNQLISTHVRQINLLNETVYVEMDLETISASFSSYVL